MRRGGVTWRFSMHRMACISIPSFALQLLVLREPLWCEYPTAVVTEEKPSGIILEINRKAKDMGVKTGMRFSAALTLAANLHAGTLREEEITDGVQMVLGILLRFSPEIEPFELCPGVFWINASGFERLYPSLSSWAEELVNGLKDYGFVARISVGFSRFGSFLAAKRTRHPLIFKDPGEERRFSRYTPLTLLPMSPKASKQLKDLGVETVGAFTDLPFGSVHKRFKKDVCQWYQFASENRTHPIQPRIPREDFILTKKFQPEIQSIKPVLLHFRQLLDHLIADVMKHNELVHTLCVSLFLEDGGEIREQVSPSRPTVRPGMLFKLIDLRLSGVKVKSNISMLEISAERVVQKGGQELLFPDHQARDLTAGAEAFTIIRAELGNDAVQHAEIKEEHLPEKRIEWVNMLEPSIARGTIGEGSKDHRSELQQLVRRVYLTRTEIMRPAFLRHDQMRKVAGPVRYQTEWWDEKTSRDYYYLEDRTGSVHWAYKNRQNGAWSFQGFVS
jgi:protein ImuB